MSMPELDTFQWIILHLCAVLIGVSKAGFGGATGVIVAPLLALVMSATNAIGIMLPLLLATDIFSLAYYWRRWDTRNVVTLVPGAWVGIFVGWLLLGQLSEAGLKQVIGGMALAFAVLQIARGQFSRSDTPVRFGTHWGLLAGFATGTTSTLAHQGGVVTTMFLLPQRMANRTFVGTTTALYFLINTSKIPFYVHRDLLSWGVVRADIPLLPSIMGGAVLGFWLNRKVSNKWFLRVILVFVILTGVKLLFFAK